MVSFFDVYSLSLLAISLAVFFVRYVRQDPPIMPYLVIACVCAVGNWLGENGGDWAAIALLTAASFLFLSLLFRPSRAQWREADARAKREKTAGGAHPAAR
ncbi:MAG: hypothetical protein RIC52_11540 [Amphiplicatus sp.]